MTPRTIAVAAALAVASGVATAKLPPLTDAQKEAAAAGAAKAAEAAKKEAELLNKYIDITVEKYKKEGAVKTKTGGPAMAPPATKQ